MLNVKCRFCNKEEKVKSYSVNVVKDYLCDKCSNEKLFRTIMINMGTLIAVLLINIWVVLIKGIN